MREPPASDGSILRPGRNCWRVATASRAAVLVDAAAYFAALRDAFERARRSILVLGWDFDPSIALDPLGSGPASHPLHTYLRWLLERRRRLEIRILVWGLSVVYGQSQDRPPFLNPDWPQHPRLLFRFANDHPFGACHHQKVVCVDDALAFAGGMDLTAFRWDLPSHVPDHPGRVDGDGVPYAPKHDVQLAVDGEAAASLAELARTRWQEATGETAPAAREGDPWPDGLAADLCGVPVGIARTRAHRGSRPRVLEAKALTLDALAAARRWIYAETQFLTSVAVGEVLADLLRRPDGPEIVLVVRHRADGWIQRLTMGENRTRLLRRLAIADRQGRLRAYFPAALDARDEEREIDVHSKVIAVDDRFLRIGSSNLNNRSLGLDSECDLAIEARDAGTRRMVRGIMLGLLAEHLGCRPDEVAAAWARHGGLIAAVERLNGTRRRRLVPFEVGEGPYDPLPGTAILDPDHPPPHTV